MVGWPGASLSGRDSLRAEGVASRPLHLILGFTVGAKRTPLDLFPEPGGSDDAHSPLAILATKDFLQCSSLPDQLSSEVPSRPCVF